MGSAGLVSALPERKECAKHGADYTKKTELAREMIDVFVSWAGDQRVELAADSAYCNDTITRGQSPSVVLFGAMRPDAVLTALPEPRAEGAKGRPSKRGAPIPKPQVIAMDTATPWETCTAELYGRTTTVRYKTLWAQRAGLVCCASSSSLGSRGISRSGSSSAPIRPWMSPASWRRTLAAGASRSSSVRASVRASNSSASPIRRLVRRPPCAESPPSSACSTPRSSSGSWKVPAAAPSPRHRCGRGIGTSATCASQTFCVRRAGPCRASTFLLLPILSGTCRNARPSHRRPENLGSDRPPEGRNPSLTGALEVSTATGTRGHLRGQEGGGCGSGVGIPLRAGGGQVALQVGDRGAAAGWRASRPLTRCSPRCRCTSTSATRSASRTCPPPATTA